MDIVRRLSAAVVPARVAQPSVLRIHAGIPAALFGVFQFIQYRTRRDKMALVSELFTKVIEALASEVEVEQARTILETTRAQMVDVGVARSQFEHAVAVLIGKPPSDFSLPPLPLR